MGIQKQDNRDAVSDRGKWSGESVCVYKRERGGKKGDSMKSEWTRSE